MSEDATREHGLFVTGEKVTDSDVHYHDYVKHLTINPEDRGQPIFEQGDRQELEKLEDPKRREIVAAMQAAEEPIDFDSRDALGFAGWRD